MRRRLPIDFGSQSQSQLEASSIHLSLMERALISKTDDHLHWLIHELIDLPSYIRWRLRRRRVKRRSFSSCRTTRLSVYCRCPTQSYAGSISLRITSGYGLQPSSGVRTMDLRPAAHLSRASDNRSPVQCPVQLRFVLQLALLSECGCLLACALDGCWMS